MEPEKLFRFLNKIQTIIETQSQPTQIHVSLPKELHFELTYRCNSACIMCNLRYLKNSYELTAKDIKNLIENSLILNNINSIILSGGEPYLNKDFLNIFKILVNKFPDKRFLILTNLNNTEKILDVLNQIKNFFNIKNLSISSSLDGIGEVHDKIRGTKDAFRNLYRTLQYLRKEFPEINFSLTFTLLPDNYDQILPTYIWSKKNQFHISYQVFVQKKETKKFTWKKKQIQRITEQINEIILNLITEANVKTLSCILDKPWFLVNLLSLYYIPKYIAKPQRYLPNCPAGYKFVMLNPSGGVYLCPVHKDKITGNIRIESLDKIWFSKKTQEIRNFFNRRSCHCWLCCTNKDMLLNALYQNIELIKNLILSNEY